MKKVVFLVAILSAVGFTGCQMNNSGVGNQVDGGPTNQNNPLYNPEYYYEIDTWGTNADVYEFTPKSNSNYICVVVGTSRGRTLQCFPKGESCTTK